MISSSPILQCPQDTLVPRILTEDHIAGKTTCAEKKNSSNSRSLLKNSSEDFSQETNPRIPDPRFALQEPGSTGYYPLLRLAEKEEDVVGCGFHLPIAATMANELHFKAEEKEEEEEVKIVSLAQESHGLITQQVSDDLHTLLTSLKVCIEQRDLPKGSRIHATIVSRGGIPQDNIFLGNTLVNLYAKCGAVAKAQEVCHELPFRTVVTWNVLIAGYAEHGPAEGALQCLKQMQLEGFSPDVITFTSVLKACHGVGTTDKVQEIHAQIEKEGLLEEDVVIGTMLVDTYVKLGALAKAREVFYKLPYCDAISWNVLVTGHAQQGCGKQALDFFEQMQLHGFSPNEVTFISTFKACATIGDTEKGQDLHAQSVKVGLDGHDIMVANALIDMYGKNGLLAEAQDVFEKLPARDVISFGGLMAGYAQHGCGKEAGMCFEHMQSEGISPNIVTFISVLKACGIIKDGNKSLQIHSQMVREGVLEEDMAVNRALVDTYAKCGLFEEAQEVFDKPLELDVFSCNMLMAEYSQHGYSAEAWSCFEQMQMKGIPPNNVTYVCILKVCANMGDSDKGEQIHDQIVKDGSMEKDVVVSTTLVDMYAKCGSLAKAQEVFDKLLVRDVITWNALIGGFSQHNRGEEAIDCYKRMQREGFSPNIVTLVCALKACGIMGEVYQGLEIHNEILKKGFLGRDAVVGTVLVDMYAKCGLLAEAQEVFDKLPVRDIVSWNALIAEYAQSGHSEEALNCLGQMQLDGLSPNTFTFSSALKACGSIGAIHVSRGIHGKLMKEGLLEHDTVVGNALVDMYSNLGMLVKAQEVFDNLKDRDVVSWNALIGGYAQLGEDTTVFKALEEMLGEGMVPDMVTFTNVLNTCSHAGLLIKGQAFYETMIISHNIFPNLEHHTCLVDLLGRAGHLEKAVAVITAMPFCANLTLWLVVLGACQRWGKSSLGRVAFQQAAWLNKMDAAAYISMGNML